MKKCRCSLCGSYGSCKSRRQKPAVADVAHMQSLRCLEELSSLQGAMPPETAEGRKKLQHAPTQRSGLGTRLWRRDSVIVQCIEALEQVRLGSFNATARSTFTPWPRTCRSADRGQSHLGGILDRRAKLCQASEEPWQKYCQRAAFVRLPKCPNLRLLMRSASRAFSSADASLLTHGGSTG